MINTNIKNYFYTSRLYMLILELINLCFVTNEEDVQQLHTLGQLFY